ncbi:hypothetical protein MJA45_08740 [Paenibacillus aurantius]|uniref:Uncharacterized protein n=1 Tax=Paenibacillus aurantius TaxID=2918900 RepID=A0AA96RH82_9BACL|nr:hypothetical protein [Paenibacillus aurantius]WNQ13093.1 hypothetical protein MJA45_08740 [Paenibacillus aurantius]
MNDLLLQWGLVSFMIGVVLSLPLAAVYYDQSPPWTKIFSNPRKLKSAHLDFFMQAFGAGLVYLLAYAAGFTLPLWIITPMIFGMMGNPLILLLESTALFRVGRMSVFYKMLKGTSPVSLLFAWIMIAGNLLPAMLLVFLSTFVLVGVFIVWRYHSKARTQRILNQG